MRLVNRILTVLKNLIVVLLGLLVLSQSAIEPGEKYQQIRSLTRMVEFDYVNWTIDALLVKNVQEAVKAPNYMGIPEQRKTVIQYFRLVDQIDQTTSLINRIYSNPDIKNPHQAAADLNRQLESVRQMEENLKPIAEAVLQHQVSETVAQMGLSFAGQPIPPILYHSTPLPNALIISPRNLVREDQDISLEPGMTTDEMDQLENEVQRKYNVSALIVPVGGIGIYPTMVMSTTDLNWLLEVVSHEWTHNYLTLRPLGLNYMSSPELRTINETTANISGKEIGLQVLRHYYPDLVPPEEKNVKDNNQPAPTPTPENPNVFSFNREMHKTRVQVDTLLAAGKIKDAEDYMELRRRFFWDHGYQIRKINQAYFAFYGAYNDQPGGGAAGQDPVGPAVQELRRRSKSLADFLNRISAVTSFGQLEQLIR